MYELLLFALEQMNGMGADMFLADAHRIIGGTGGDELRAAADQAGQRTQARTDKGAMSNRVDLVACRSQTIPPAGCKDP